jgi:hypothetical protein
MSRKLCYVAAVVALIAVVGFVGAQVGGTKPASSAVVAKEKEPPKTLEERMADVEKNQQKILGELKAIKENQEKILADTKKIFTRMKKN